VTQSTVRNVRDLAAQLGISVKEAVALCVVSGHAVKGPDDPVSAEQATRARDVLEGRASMSVPATPGQTSRALVIGLGVVVLLGILVVIGAAVKGYLDKQTTIAVRAGQCFDDPGAFGKELTAVPCEGEHDFVAEAVLDLNPVFGDEFPGWSAIEEHAKERCAALGTGNQVDSLMGPGMEFYYFGPQDARSWENPRARKIVCAARAD
jgi:hypothetical protein